VNGYYADRLEGMRPNRIHSTQLGYGADIGLTVGGFDALTMVLMRNTSHPNTGLPQEKALGVMAELHYLHPTAGFELGARFALLDPSNVIPHSRLSEIAGMIGYRLKKVPLRLVLQYTLRGEEPAVSVANDSLDAMAQVSW
jgi:hypothetical protein